MEKLKLYTVTKGSTDGTIEMGNIIYLDLLELQYFQRMPELLKVSLKQQNKSLEKDYILIQ